MQHSFFSDFYWFQPLHWALRSLYRGERIRDSAHPEEHRKMRVEGGERSRFNAKSMPCSSIDIFHSNGFRSPEPPNQNNFDRYYLKVQIIQDD